MKGTSLLVITNWRDMRHPETGGAEVVCHELARRYAAHGQNVVLLAAHVDGAGHVEEHDGYRIVRGGGRFTVYAHGLLWLFRNRAQIDAVIDSQNGIPFFSPLAVRRSTAVVMLLHHVHQDQFDKYFSRPAATLGRWLESTASRAVYGTRSIVTVSPSTRTEARRLLGLEGDIWITPPGWSVSESVRSRPSARTAQPSLVCLGRLVPHKRVELVLTAMPHVISRHPNVRLTVIGRGPEEAHLKALAAKLGLGESVSFRSDLDDLARDELVSTSWLTVNASQGEGWGLSVVEANALGVPALAFRRPGLKDSIVDGETGWLIDDDELLGEAIAEALTELHDVGRARQVAQHARHWAARFTWDAMAQRVLNVISAEQHRLARQGRDRRTMSDLSSVVTILEAALPEGWQQRLRETDVWERAGDVIYILCRSADERSIETLLGRVGVSEDSTEGATYSVSVARTADFLRLSVPAGGGELDGE